MEVREEISVTAEFWGYESGGEVTNSDSLLL